MKKIGLYRKPLATTFYTGMWGSSLTLSMTCTRSGVILLNGQIFRRL